MKFFIAILSLVFGIQILFAQTANNAVKKGNDAYKKGDYKTAQENYLQALTADPKNNAARFNLGNAQQKQNNADAAEKQYDEIITNAVDSSLMSSAYYNKGLSLIAQKKLIDAIDAFKKSLLLSPGDNDTRENLQKAMNELRLLQQKQNPQPQKQNKQPKKNDSKLNQQKAEQYLQQLRDQEKKLQKALQKKSTNNQPEEDW